MIAAVAAAWIGTAPGLAQESGFHDGPDGAVVHVSGFVCPAKIGSFVRDANGLRDPGTGADYCAYSALSGVYGTVIVMPLPPVFDPRSVLAPEFRIQEGVHGHLVDELFQPVGPVPVYRRIYETDRLPARQYRTLYACAAVGAWAVVTIVEYSEPGERDAAPVFLNAVYGAAAKALTGNP